jgi:DNA-3-methyladenine glycosylase
VPAVLPPPLPRAFYARSPTELAPDLVGALIIRLRGGELLTARIVETEAYLGPQDRASHARSGLTRRTRSMFGPPGHAYVYRLYGMHWAFNVVGHAEGEEAGAVLVRAALPLLGVDAQRRARGRPDDRVERLAAGPGRLCQALGITGTDDGHDLTVGCSPPGPGVGAGPAPATLPDSALWLAAAGPGDRDALLVGPRVNVDSAGEPWASRPFRFALAGSPALSVRFGSAPRAGRHGPPVTAAAPATGTPSPRSGTGR